MIKNKRRGRPPKYATDEERKQALFEQIKKYQDKNPEMKNKEVYYYGYSKKELITDKDKERFKDNILDYLKFKANFNFLYEKYPEIMDEIFNDKTQIIINK